MRATNAYTEALNGLIRVADRQGRGYSFDVIRAKIVFAPVVHKRKVPKSKAEKAFTKFLNELVSQEPKLDTLTLPYVASKTRPGLDFIVAGRMIETMFSTTDPKR